MTERTKAILLFTAYFAKDTDKVHKPLSLTEWNKFAKWLTTKLLNPEDFLTSDSIALLAEWHDQTISRNRLNALLERKTALALALDKWSRAGIWIVSRGDAAYPVKIKEKLKNQAPNIFFGIGSKELLQSNYAAIIGSRDATESDLSIAADIASALSLQDYGVVSGGAKGVDEAAMLGALDNGGRCVGIMADSLIKKSTSSAYRKHILNDQLVLLSPYNPDASFNAGNAMGRNKLIYAMSDLAIVVKSDTKGGTWEGAKENLKNNWVPLWICDAPEKGNKELLKLGGKLLDTGAVSMVSNLIHAKPSANLFSVSQEPAIILKVTYQDMGLYELFLKKWSEIIGSQQVSNDMLASKLSLTTSQVQAWINQAVKSKHVQQHPGEEQFWSLTVALTIL